VRKDYGSEIEINSIKSNEFYKPQMPYYSQRISNGVCGFSAPRLVWGSPTQSNQTALVMRCITMKYLLRRCEIFLAENEIPYGMKYLPFGKC
jgi:hypothetical protein